MDLAIWLAVTVIIGLFFTGLGIFACRRKKPMWFWSGSTVEEDEITDIPAYNRANGRMWICFSLVFWISAVMGIFGLGAAGAFLAIGTVAGIPVLVIVYGRIYKKYKSDY